MRHLLPASPRAAAERVERSAALPRRPGEHFAGFGVMGLPFDSGHYLALRRFPANTVGGPYHSVWHRNLHGEWVFYSDSAPMNSCARYFDAALGHTEMACIRLHWPGPDQLAVIVDDVLDWTVQLQRTPATAALSGLGHVLPEPLWRSPKALRVLARFAGPVLRAGRVGLTGRLPNGQTFTASPRQLWAVSASSARIHGVDLGSPAPLTEQTRLGDFWLPQRGLFAIGEVGAEEFDPLRHRPARAARKTALD